MHTDYSMIENVTWVVKNTVEYIGAFFNGAPIYNIGY